MGRLITEESIYEYLSSKFDEFDISIFGNEFAGKILDGLSDIPTAYDVEKVEAELEKLNSGGIRMIEDGKYELIRKKEALEVVRKGGVE